MSITNNEREALLLAGNLFTEEDADELERVIVALYDGEMIDQLQAVQARFDELPADASRDEIDRAIDAAMELLGPSSIASTLPTGTRTTTAFPSAPARDNEEGSERGPARRDGSSRGGARGAHPRTDSLHIFATGRLTPT
ncbi:MAG: hypothetical protein V8R48_08190 [Eggerthella lenta]